MSKLLMNNKNLMKEYNFNKNIDIDLEKITEGSNKKVWWICKEGHEWETRINHRSNGSNCPYCSGNKVLEGYNDIFSTHPFLKEEWDFKNNFLDPYDISAGSSKTAQWICKNGHNYDMRISHRASKHGCPYCSGRKVIKGQNDFETYAKINNPNVLKRWDYENNKKLPYEYTKFSHSKVHWKCDMCGYLYSNPIAYEILNINCPKCNRRNQTSFPEQALYFYIKKIFPDAISGYKIDGVVELDIYIPSKKIGVEYDGMNWHKSEKALEREINKYLYCQKKEIKLIRFKENDYNSKQIIANEIYLSSYNKSVEKFSEEIGDYLKNFSKKIDVNISRDRNEIMNQYTSNLREKSLENLYPEIVKRWDYEKNYPITPAMISAHSNEKFYFKCDVGHLYEKSIDKIVSRKDGCPYCSGRKVMKGFNDIATTNPGILEEWDYEKNVITPYEISSGSNKKVWWKCTKCKNKFFSSPNSRIGNNTGCKYCNGGTTKKVNQYDLDGNYITTHDSGAEAGRKLDISNANISRACKNKKTCGGFQWRYADDIYVPNKNIEKYTNKKTKSVK